MCTIWSNFLNKTRVILTQKHWLFSLPTDTMWSAEFFQHFWFCARFQQLQFYCLSMNNNQHWTFISWSTKVTNISNSQPIYVTPYLDVGSRISWVASGKNVMLFYLVHKGPTYNAWVFFLLFGRICASLARFSRETDSEDMLFFKICSLVFRSGSFNYLGLISIHKLYSLHIVANH